MASRRSGRRSKSRGRAPDEETFEPPSNAGEEGAGAARPFWRGTVTFGLVSIPVEFYSSTRTARVRTRLIDDEGVPLTRQYYCPADGEPLSSDDIVRGFEHEGGHFVVVTDEEMDMLAPDKTNDIELKRFVDAGQIPPLQLERLYYLAPSGGSTKAYDLLAATMERSHRAGVATFVMRGRERVIAIEAVNGILRAETLRFPDEARTPATVGLPDTSQAQVDDARVRTMEGTIGELMRETMEPGELEDRYHNRVQEALQRKQHEGRDLFEAPTEVIELSPEAEQVDILQLLKERLARDRARPSEGAERPAASRPPGRSGTGPEAELQELTKRELYERAQARGIEGRSRMSKDELVEALSA